MGVAGAEADPRLTLAAPGRLTTGPGARSSRRHEPPRGAEGAGYGGGELRRCVVVRVYTDFTLPYEERWRAVKGWFATANDYEDFRVSHPDADPRYYLEEVGEFAAPFPKEGSWYLPRRVALGIASVLLMEDIGWIPTGCFRQELLRDLDEAEELEGAEPVGMRLLYASPDGEEEEEEEE